VGHGVHALVAFLSIAFRFFEPWVGGQIAWEFTLARILSLIPVGYVFVALVQIYEGVMHRLHNEQQLSAKLYTQSTTDLLTGLPNRLLFNDRLNTALARSKRSPGGLAVFFLDLDQFKRVNDSFGHEAGDSVLKETARRFVDCLRKSDTVCRLGADSFLAFATDLTSPVRDVTMLSERLMEEMARPFTVAGREIFLTVSIGISLSPNDGVEVETLVKNADLAVSRAKERGRNQFVFYQPEINQAAAHRLTVESELRLALTRDDLVVFYQPKIDCQTGAITGAEALVRWKHPTRGMVSPADFIPVAEETRLIVPLDRYVLRKACAQLKAWHLAGFQDLRISVNLSARHFQTDDLPASVEAALREAQLPPSALELEITESTMMQNTDATVRVLEQLKTLGVIISLDDFGTGYSSLGYLKRFPVDCMKIDRTLISDGREGSQEAALTRAIIALGHSFGLEVVAEGVETAQQRDFLKRVGCDGLQGFLFSRPVEPQAFERLLVAAVPAVGTEAEKVLLDKQ
jgi:diguanylate cyclase (GGDEF)-like protein